MLPTRQAILRIGLLAFTISGSLFGRIVGADDLPNANTTTATISAPLPTPPMVPTEVDLSSTTVVETDLSTTSATMPVSSTPTSTTAPLAFSASTGTMIFTSTASYTFVATSSPVLAAPAFSSTTVSDPYRWLEEGTSDQVKAWVNTEDRTARDYLAKLPARESLKHRLNQMLSDDEVSVPGDCGGKIVYSRRGSNQDKPTFYWRFDYQTDEHVLLKPKSRNDEVVEKWSVSPDGKMFAYQVKRTNSRRIVLRVRNIESWHENSRDEIAGVDAADISWTNDGKGFYYVSLPTDPAISPTERAGMAEVRFHTLGKPSPSDPVIFSESHNPGLRLAPTLSGDGQWLFVSMTSGGMGTHVLFKEIHDSSSTFKPLFVSTSATAQVAEWAGAFYIRTNEGSPNFRIVKTYTRQTAPSFWKDVVPERPDTIIRSMNIVGGYLVLTIMRNAMIGIEVRSSEGALTKTSLDPAPGEIPDLRGQENSQCAYFEFNSVVLPRRIYKLAPQDGTIKTWSDPPRPFDDSPYEGTQVKYHSKDGTLVSMDIITRKGMPLDGTVPFLMEGVGEFGIPATLRFDPMIIAWLQAGGAYALPHLRGGGDYGEAWHRAGMGTQKQNTIDDFIAAAEFLIDNKYTSHERLVIQGVSNSGVLMGAAMTQRPELFRAVVSKDGLFDMIRYPQFGEGQAWIPEYGSPEVEDQFHALLGYSPYHNIKPGTLYPATLILAQEGDDRMDPMHARKMTAALQAAMAVDSNPILFEMERMTNHAGSDSKQFQVEDYVDRLSFLMDAVGLKPAD